MHWLQSLRSHLPQQRDNNPMKTKNQLITGLSILAIIIAVILYLYLTPPSYNQLINEAEQKMNQVENINLIYTVTYEEQTPNNYLQETSKAYYNKTLNGMEWVNGLTNNQEESDINPVKALNLMKESNVSAVEYYQDDITCNLLNGYLLKEVENYYSVRVMACLNKTTGYPEQYTFFYHGDNEGFIVSYQLFTPIQQPLNNTINSP